MGYVVLVGNAGDDLAAALLRLFPADGAGRGEGVGKFPGAAHYDLRVWSSDRVELNAHVVGGLDPEEVERLAPLALEVDRADDLESAYAFASSILRRLLPDGRDPFEGLP